MVGSQFPSITAFYESTPQNILRSASSVGWYKASQVMLQKSLEVDQETSYKEAFKVHIAMLSSKQPSLHPTGVQQGPGGLHPARGAQVRARPPAQQRKLVLAHY